MSPNAGGREGVVAAYGVLANEYKCAHGAQINFGDLTPYLTYAAKPASAPSFLHAAFLSDLVITILCTLFENCIEI
jgi:hypothetical protein